MATVLFLGPARDVTGVRSEVIEGVTVAEVLQRCVARHGAPLADLILVSQTWLNGEAVDPSTPVADQDEVAILPPVSGG